MRSRVITIFLLLWLPLQGWAAVVMPFCPHSLGDDVSAGASTHLHGDQHAKQHDHGHSGTDHDRQHGTPHMGFSCNDCGACHLACAPAVASGSLPLAASPGSTQPDSAPLFISLFDPEQRKRPPLV